MFRTYQRIERQNNLELFQKIQLERLVKKNVHNQKRIQRMKDEIGKLKGELANVQKFSQVNDINIHNSIMISAYQLSL